MEIETSPTEQETCISEVLAQAFERPPEGGAYSIYKAGYVQAKAARKALGYPEAPPPEVFAAAVEYAARHGIDADELINVIFSCWYESAPGGIVAAWEAVQADSWRVDVPGLPSKDAAALATLAYQLADNSDAPVFLPCRTVGELLGKSHMHAARILKNLCRLGVLEVTKQHDFARHKAAEYRFTQTLENRGDCENVTQGTQASQAIQKLPTHPPAREETIPEPEVSTPDPGGGEGDHFSLEEEETTFSKPDKSSSRENVDPIGIIVDRVLDTAPKSGPLGALPRQAEAVLVEEPALEELPVEIKNPGVSAALKRLEAALPTKEEIAAEWYAAHAEPGMPTHEEPAYLGEPDPNETNPPPTDAPPLNWLHHFTPAWKRLMRTATTDGTPIVELKAAGAALVAKAFDADNPRGRKLALEAIAAHPGNLVREVVQGILTSIEAKKGIREPIKVLSYRCKMASADAADKAQEGRAQAARDRCSSSTHNQDTGPPPRPYVPPPELGPPMQIVIDKRREMEAAGLLQAAPTETGATEITQAEATTPATAEVCP